MLKILCVDDDADMRGLIALGLEVDGFAEVTEARDGWDAIEKARLVWPDLILMDIMMPHMNGIEAIRRLRQIEAALNVPIIVISAKYNHELMEHALSIGANEYITKPFMIEALKQTISGYFDGTTSMVQLERRRRRDVARAAAQAADAKRMELAYALAVWRNNPELAATLEQLTHLAGGIIHDLRNRLGILSNYNDRAAYCLWLLESLAFLCFKPSLSRQVCRGNLRQPEIPATAISPPGGQQPLPLRFTRLTYQGRTVETSGVTAKGLIDPHLLARTLGLLCQALTADRPNRADETAAAIIIIEDHRLRDPHFAVHLKISLRSAANEILPFPYKINCSDVLLGDQLAVVLLLVRKAIFLHMGDISLDESGAIHIKIEDRLKPGWSLDKPTTLLEKIATCADNYDGVDPNIYPLVDDFILLMSQILEIISTEAREPDGASQRALAMIQRNCRYAQLLLQNLMWLGVGVELPGEPVDIGETLRTVQQIMSSEIRSRSDDEAETAVAVRLDIEPNVSYVWSNRVSLQQVFMNLMTNALEAMPEGGWLTMRVFRQGAVVCAEINDTGSGVSPQEAAQMFDLAFSTKQGRERGIGLHIVKSIIDKWGGKIKVMSKVGEGTTFRICLRPVETVLTLPGSEHYVRTPSCLDR